VTQHGSGAPKPAVTVITPSYGRFNSLLACIDSVQASSLVPEHGLEVVVVTSGYTEDEVNLLRNRGCKVTTLTRPESTSSSRNIGVGTSSGRHLLFLDDDNVIAKETVSVLSRSLDSWPDAAVVGPAMYYGSEPDRIWCAGVRRSRILMKTTFRQQLPEPTPDRMPSEDFPNCFMVRRADFDVVGGFDALRFPQQWEEGDLARRLVKATRGRVYAVPSARVWHYIDSDLVQRLHLRNAARAYLVARGRAMFTAIHGDKVQWIAYLLAAQWMFGAFYLSAAFWLPRSQRTGVFRGYIRGLFAGLTDGWRARAQQRLAQRGSSARTHSS
jgi:GT2 family glycosyltransferase